MTEKKRVVIIGGHGKIALLTAPRLAAAGYAVDSVIRAPEQADDVREAGANPVLLDVERAGVEELARLFEGADAVVFSAGAGGGNPARTRAVDYEAAVRTMDAAEQAGVTRYAMVSYVRSETDVFSLDKENSFYPYAEAKHLADNHLRSTGLDYTILGPGMLTTEPASGAIRVLGAGAAAAAASGAPDTAGTSRENVAEAIVHVLTTGAAIRETVNFFDGDTPIAEAIESSSR